MGLFARKKKDKKPSREQILTHNAGVAFTTDITEKDESEKLAYNYERVKCSIIGDVSDLREGAVLYTQRNGVLSNVASENVAQIDNEKLRAMVNDFFDKEGRFSSTRAKYVSQEEDSLYINLGFYIDTDNSYYDDDENDADDDYDSFMELIHG